MNDQSQLLFPSLEVEDAPSASRPLLQQVRSGFGFVPNLFAAFSNSPVLLEGYITLSDAFDKGTLTAAERQLVLLAASVQNECSYCIAAHSTVAKGMLRVPAEVAAAIRTGQPLADVKLGALVNLTKELVARRGHVSSGTLAAFLDAGYVRAQVAEVLVGVGLKTLSNYTHHLSPIAIDPAFQAKA